MADFVDDGLRRGKKIDCFDFVPSDPASLLATLSALVKTRFGEAISGREPTRFCEWGSGIGIGVGITEMLGFSSVGIEIDTELADASRALLKDHGLRSNILTGSYYEIECPSDFIFFYGWPSQIREIRPRFAQIAVPETTLLICHGAEDFRGERLAYSTQHEPAWLSRSVITIRGSPNAHLSTGLPPLIRIHKLTTTYSLPSSVHRQRWSFASWVRKDARPLQI